MSSTRAMLLAAAIVLSVIGLFLLLRSPIMARAAADDWLRGLGGGADSALYLEMLRGFGETYRVLGGVLLGAGLWRLLDSARPPRH